MKLAVCIVAIIGAILLACMIAGADWVFRLLSDNNSPASIALLFAFWFCIAMLFLVIPIAGRAIIRRINALLGFRKVSTRVNKPGNDGPELIERTEV